MKLNNSLYVSLHFRWNWNTLCNDTLYTIQNNRKVLFWKAWNREFVTSFKDDSFSYHSNLIKLCKTKNWVRQGKKKTHHNLDTELELSQNVRDHKQSGFHSRYYNEPVVNLPESNKHSESHYRLVN